MADSDSNQKREEAVEAMSKPRLQKREKEKETTLTKCRICGKEAVDKDYCKLHEKAYRNLRMKFGFWKRALGLTWKCYLAKVAITPHIGSYAREVAEALLSEEKWKPNSHLSSLRTEDLPPT